MAICRDPLPSDPAELARRIIDLQAEVERLNGLVAAFRTLLFGPRSERHPPTDQLTLGLGAPDPPEVVLSALPPPNPRTQPRRGREARRNLGALPTHLPREEEVIEPMATACPCCGGGLHRIGADVRESLGVRPVSFFVTGASSRSPPAGLARAPSSRPSPRPARSSFDGLRMRGGLAGDDLLVHGDMRECG